MALQIFDVSNAEAPTRTHLHTIPGAYSQAQWDHLAFNYDARLGLLAIPVETYEVTFDSSLALFRVSLEDGIAPKDKDVADAPDPATRRLRRELTQIRSFIRARPTTQDLFQVAQLWLGARMVAASVNGEDWTALWSESLDLDLAGAPKHAIKHRDAGCDFVIAVGTAIR